MDTELSINIGIIFTALSYVLITIIIVKEAVHKNKWYLIIFIPFVFLGTLIIILYLSGHINPYIKPAVTCQPEETIDVR